MTPFLMPRKQHSDLHPRLGPGLFDDERVPGSIDRAVAAIAGYIASMPDNEKKLTKPFDETVARVTLREPIRKYWADNDHDNRTKFSDLNKQARQFRKEIKRFDELIKGLSTPMKAALRMSLTRSYGEAPPGEDRLAAVHEMTGALIKSCKSLIEPKYRKSADRGVVSLAEPLWIYWETMRHEPFRRSWDDCDTRMSLVKQLGPHSFSRPDALFVQVVIKSIDPNAEFSDIRTRLKSVAKKRPKASKSRRAGAR